MMKWIVCSFGVVLISLCGCTSLRPSGEPNNACCYLLKEQVATLKQVQRGLEVELSLLGERVEDEFRMGGNNRDARMFQQKLAYLEREVERLKSDLLAFSTSLDGDRQLFSQYLGEISELRETLAQSDSNLSSQHKRYRVKAGDTIDKISRQFKVSHEALRKENQLSSNLIWIGQELVIPRDR